MRPRLDLLRVLLALINFTLITVVIFSIYLLAGESIADDFKRSALSNSSPDKRSRSISSPAASSGSDEVVDGIHQASGLIFAEGFEVVRGNCTGCHSAKLITQNLASRDGWEEMIRWMQAKQGLWDLGKNEPIILDYLAKNYAPVDKGRRANLQVEDISWYILELEPQ